MKRTHIERTAEAGGVFAEPARPVNAIEHGSVYGRTVQPAEAVAKPRLLARRNARIARRATR